MHSCFCIRVRGNGQLHAENSKDGNSFEVMTSSLIKAILFTTLLAKHGKAKFDLDLNLSKIFQSSRE